MPRVAALTAAALLFAAPASTGDVTLVGPEGRVALSEAAQADAAAEWKAREARPHLYLRDEPSVVMPRGVRGGPSTHATEVLIGIANPKFPEQPLMCQPALRPYFDKAAADHSCRILEQVRRQN